MVLDRRDDRALEVAGIRSNRDAARRDQAHHPPFVDDRHGAISRDGEKRRGARDHRRGRRLRT